MSLKSKFSILLSTLVICSILCLGYGIWGSEQILNASKVAQKEAYPVLSLANGLSQVIHNTNAAFMQAIDGEKEFSMSVEQEAIIFQGLIDEMRLGGHNLSSIDDISRD